MIKVYRASSSWRISIENETFEFKTTKEFEEILNKIVKMKEKYEPYKNG